LNADLREDVFYLALREASDPNQYGAIEEQVLGFLDQQMPNLVADLIPTGHVGFLYPWENEKVILDHRLTLGFYGSSQDEFDDHIKFVAGSFPKAENSTPDEIPVLIGKFLAEALALENGDLLPASVSARGDQPEVDLRISGIITPKDYQDPYWLDHFNPFWPQEGNGEIDIYGIFIPKESFFQLANTLYPGLDISYSWLVNLNLDQFSFQNINDMQRLFATLENDVLLIDDGLRVHTSLANLLRTYSTQANIARAPLYFLIGIIVLIILYYLVMMSSLYLRQLSGELAVMRSRGASSSTIFKLSLFESFFFGSIAIVSGPILAWGIVRLSAFSGPLSILAEPGWGLSIPQSAWLSAGIAAIACSVSLLAPLPRALKRSVIAHQQSLVRDERSPWWQRFYLDVFILAIGIVLLYRVQLYGSIIGGSADNPQIDLMLILAPLCLLLGAAAIFLRIFPVILHWGAQLASQGRGLPMVLALQHAARDPRHVTRLVLLLMLAMTLGLFSTSLDATLTKNEVDRADYYVGSDLRVIADPAFVPIEEIPSLLGESWVWRTDAALITRGVSPGINLLAVDPDTFSQVANFRRDFSNQNVSNLLAALPKDWEENRIPLPVTLLPGKPAQINLWFSLPFSMQVDPDRYEMIPSITFEARLRTNQGDDIYVELHPVPPPDDPEARWYAFEGQLSELSVESYPLSLISLWLHSSNLQLGDFEAIWIDDISVVDRLTKNETVVESFEYANQFVWKSLTYPMRIYSMESHPHTGDASLSMYFDRVGISPLRWYGFSRIDDQKLQPIPALVSPDFLAQTELQVGDLVRIKVKVPDYHEWDQITFKILGLVNYFPTLYEDQEAGFLVAMKKPLFEQINLYRYTPLQSTELLIASDDPDRTYNALLEGGLLPDQVFSADTTLLELKTNPMAIGLRSVTLFGYYLTTILSLVGFGTHFYMSTRQRAANYSILRAMGLSPGQLYTTLLVEQIILMLSGLALGTVLGLLLNQLTLSGLPLRLGELDTIPPFIVQTDWALIIQVYFTLVIAFLLSLGLAILFLWRVQIHRVLRIAEE